MELLQEFVNFSFHRLQWFGHGFWNPVHRDLRVQIADLPKLILECRCELRVGLRKLNGIANDLHVARKLANFPDVSEIRN